jgi:nucleoside-diphosphate kinase
MERTCVLVKPDGVGKHLIGTVAQRFEKAGLRLAGLKMLRLDRTQAESFYKEHVGKPFYEPLIVFMTSAPIVAMIWEGVQAVKMARGLMGATDSAKAEPGTLRREFGTNNRYNLVHGSDSPASAEREIAFFFKPEELYTYGDQDWQTESVSPLTNR